MSSRQRPPVPGLLAGASMVVFDTAFPRHLAVLGAPYLTKVIGGVVKGGRIPPAVHLELTKAKRYAPSVIALLPPSGLFVEVPLTPTQAAEAEALAKTIPVKSGAPLENLGEAQAIIAAQHLSCPLVLDDGHGIERARGRQIPLIHGVHLLIHAEAAGCIKANEGWDIWTRVCSPGVGFLPSTARTGWDTCAECEKAFASMTARLRGGVAGKTP